ncbi:MAG: DUF5615 family PIN-like protein [Planctomycetota bacterium]
MHFLLDANLPRSLISVVERSGHTCTHVRDTSLAAATDAQIAAHVQSTGLILMTRDLDFADVRSYPPAEYPGLVVFRLPDTATAATICELAAKLLSQPTLIDVLPGRLALVEFGRVRFRPPFPFDASA